MHDGSAVTLMLVHNKTLVASLEDAIVDLRALLWLAVPILQNIGAVEVPLATFGTLDPQVYHAPISFLETLLATGRSPNTELEANVHSRPSALHSLDNSLPNFHYHETVHLRSLGCTQGRLRHITLIRSISLHFANYSRMYPRPTKLILLHDNHNMLFLVGARDSHD